ncbi:phage head closure protein [Bacillus subtilis]|uniref:phage head closure protein n=1 Tax=Bacillus subtilis TaxID=1423 RepID=UPI000345E387|nr:phage head closure protein [Bacillus subtilis]
MDFSRLDTPISFIRIKNGKDENGENSEVKETLFWCFAEIKNQKLRDKVATLGTVFEDTITFIVRYEQPMKITNDMKVLYDGELYDIEDVLPNSRKKDMKDIVVKKVS